LAQIKSWESDGNYYRLVNIIKAEQAKQLFYHEDIKRTLVLNSIAHPQIARARRLPSLFLTSSEASTPSWCHRAHPVDPLLYTYVCAASSGSR